MASSLCGALLAGATVAASPSVHLFSKTLELETSGVLESRYVQRVHASSPRENPSVDLWFHLGADLGSRTRLEAEAHGLAGGAPRDPDGPGLFRLRDVRQDRSPSLELEEAWIETAVPRGELRAGLQKFAWGKLDGIQPNDLLDPEAYGDPILEEEHRRKIGVPALSLSLVSPRGPAGLFPEGVELTGVWVPVPAAWRFPDQDERWYPPLARPPARSRVDGFVVDNRATFRNRKTPARGLRDGAGAARLAGSAGGVDFAAYYFDGLDPSPALDAKARGFVRFDPTRPGCIPLQPSCFDVRSEIDVFPVFQRIRAAGADLAYNAFGVTFRAEAAWVKNRLFAKAIREVIASQRIGPVDPVRLLSGEEQEVRVDLAPVNVRREAIEWGAGADTVWWETFFLLQVNQTAILDNRVDLLLSDTETRFAATVRRSFLDDRLHAEIQGLYGLQGVYGVAHPRLTYDLADSMDLRVGYVWIAGHFESIVGQYRDNDQAYVRFRYSF
jgi:hypothetical protein